MIKVNIPQNLMNCSFQASRKYKVPSRTLYDKIKKMGISTVPRRMPSKKPSPSSTDLETSTGETHAPPEPHEPPTRDARDSSLQEHDKRLTKSVTSDDDDHSASGAPVVIDDEDESSSPTPGSTPALGSFSLVGRKMYENGAGESSAKPLDLTDTESLIPKRPEIEERA